MPLRIGVLLPQFTNQEASFVELLERWNRQVEVVCVAHKSASV